MPPTNNSQPRSASGSGEEWLENIRCPTYFDFEAAVAYPCTLGDVNPPLLETVYDSDDETRSFFRSLYEDPSQHPTLHRRSLSPQRNRLQTMGKPLYRHRPKTSFAEYLAEFKQKHTHDTDGAMGESIAMSSKPDASPARGLSLQTNTSTSDDTPSPPQNVFRGTRSDVCTPQVFKDRQSAPQRRSRRSPASLASVEGEQKASQEQARPPAQPNPARRKPPPLDRSVNQAKCSRAAKSGPPSISEFPCSKNAVERVLENGVMRGRSAQDSRSSEKDCSSSKWSPAARSGSTLSSTDIEGSAVDKSAFSVDVDLFKIMKEHNERLRKSKSERGAGSSCSNRSESDGAMDDNLQSAVVTSTSASEAICRGSVLKARNGNTKASDLREHTTRVSKVGSEDNSTIPSAKSCSFRRNSLSHLLEVENERVLEERKRRLPERRKALQQNRRNALRNIRSSGLGERRINPISAQIDFTSAETTTSLPRPNDNEQSNTRAEEEKPLPDPMQLRNRERGFRGYRSRNGPGRSIVSSNGLTVVGSRTKTTNLCSSGRSKTNTDRTLLKMDTKRDESHLSPVGETEEVRQYPSTTGKEVSDDLNLLLTEHNNKIRRNRNITGTINI
eukprot:TRINITY_DN62988_c0_g1_i1.p1 TRINITY_DN62988_c0_g1~~TRINITY_DN62988_c0_g1_i1.p1  ORF type:complete len:615 (-),score=79.96 TRINITY_DN62988_c0_g1_i1:1104-2948(-)